MQTIVCMKWGTLYPSIFVNRLYSSIQRNTDRETRLICYTDDSSGIDSRVITQPLPYIDLPADAYSWWRKVGLFSPDLGDGDSLLSGELLFMDLDLVITGNIDQFFDYAPGKFCIVHNPTRTGKRIGNTSIFRFRFGDYHEIYENYVSDPSGTVNSHFVEQNYVSSMITDKLFWPSEWIPSFRRHLVPLWPLNFIFSPRLPSSAIAVLFTTNPKQDDAAKGIWPVAQSWKKLYKHVRPTRWIDEHWR